jgi:hypothetical protein
MCHLGHMSQLHNYYRLLMDWGVTILFVKLQGLWIAFWAIDTIGYIFVFGSFVFLDFVFT